MKQETLGAVWHNKELVDGVELFQVELRYSDYIHSELEGGRDDGLFGQKQLALSTHLDYHANDSILEFQAQYLNSDLQVCHEHGKCTKFYDAQRTSIVDGVQLEQNLNNLGYAFGHGHPMPNISESTIQAGLNMTTYTDDDTELSATIRLEHRLLTSDSSNIQEQWLVNSNVNPNYYDESIGVAPSISVGALGYISDNLFYQTSIAYIERFPSASEMFWNGFHHATDSYIFGDRYLDNEESINLDISLMHEYKNFTTVFGGFYYHFNNYIFQEQLTDNNNNIIKDPFHNTNVWQIKGKDAKVYGVALKESYKSEYKSHYFLSSLSLEALKGILNDGGYIPRMPPYNATLELQHILNKLTTTLKYKYIDESRSEAVNETRTPSYSWLSFYMEYENTFKYGSYSLFFKGENLTNELAYNHLSFLKDTAPLPGRQLTFGASLKF